MGEVYRAVDLNLGRHVAIKIVPDPFAHDRERLARFEREAKTLASLNDPHIAQIHGLEKSDGLTALVMELVDGPTLADRIAQGSIALDEALAIATQIANALEAAHERGIIHRDLKPANIKVRPDGVVKVLDFGLAKALSPDSVDTAPAALTNSPTLTRSPTFAGVVLGTAAYMSPEQARGKSVDKRTDLWAFGCVLYEMLTGRAAFEGDDAMGTIAAVLRAEPDWRAIPQAVPESIRTLVRECLHKDRLARIGDISVILFLLKSAGGESVISSSSPPSSRAGLKKMMIAATVAAIITALTTALIVSRLRPKAPSPLVARFSYALPPDQALGLKSGGRKVITISPDGQRLAYALNGQLWVRSLADADARALPGTNVGPSNAVFSPDGQFIAFFAASDQTLKRVAIAGGAPQMVAALPNNPSGISWHGDTILLTPNQGRGVNRVAASGGTLETIIRVQETETVQGPQMLPDNQSVLYSVAAANAGPDRWNQARIVVQRIGSDRREVLVEGGHDAHYLSTGHLAYVSQGVPHVVVFDLSRLKKNGDAQTSGEGVRVDEGTGNAHFDISATGSLIYIPGASFTSPADRRLILVDRSGKPEPLNVPVRPYHVPRFSPDGRRIAVETDDGKRAHIRVIEIDGSRQDRELTLEGRNRFPVWTRDGTSIAFQSDRDGDRAIFWQRADGSGKADRLTRPGEGEAHIPSWADMDRLLYFARPSGRRGSLKLSSSSDRSGKVLAEFPAAWHPNAAVSPDGRWVAYNHPATDQRPKGAQSMIVVRPLSTTDAQSFTIDNEINPVWSKQGKELIYGDSSGFTAVTVTTQQTFTYSSPSPIPSVDT
jgi:serine/threonine-protein kinase